MDAARARAAALDAADGLAPFRERFVFAPDTPIYLDGNSLGRMPRATAERLRDVVESQWATHLIGGWNAGWWEAPRRIGDKIGRLIGAQPGETLLTDSVSVNLFKATAALLGDTPDARTVYVESTNFPSDHYIAQGLAGMLGGAVSARRIDLDTVATDGVLAALDAAFSHGPGVAILAQVAFKSGLRLDPAAVGGLARRRGVRVVWDLSHSVGAVPIDVHRDSMEAAVGCTYKYLNGGPGAPAFVFVESSLASRLANPIAGWFGHADPFAMRLDYEAAPGTTRFLAGTTPILSASAVEVGVDLIIEAGIEALWAKSRAQVAFARALAEEHLAAFGVAVVTPREAHGSHLALAHPEARRLCRALIARGVVPDFRAPDVLRLGFAPIYTRFADIAEGIARLHAILESGAWQSLAEAPAETVT